MFIQNATQSPFYTEFTILNRNLYLFFRIIKPEEREISVFDSK